MTSSVTVNFVLLLSKTHIERGRYALSVDIAQKEETESVIKKRKEEIQVYIEYGCIAGACSPETELQLQNGKCEVQLVISGALEPTSPLEEGESMVEYNEKLGECRKLLNLKPTYEVSTEGNATIKFMVSGKVKHTVHIHDVPTEKDPLHRSFSSSSSFMSVSGAGADRRISAISDASYLSMSSTDETFSDSGVMEGTVRENTISTSGLGSSVNVNAVPIQPGELDDMMSDMAIQNRSRDVMQADQYPVRTAYDLLLSNESLMTLSWVLSPTDATRLLIGLSVPNHILEHNRKNHTGDVVTGNYGCFLFWRNEKSSRKQAHEACNQHLYEDLLVQLGDMGRNDIKDKIKKTLEKNKKLEQKDFKHF